MQNVNNVCIPAIITQNDTEKNDTIIWTVLKTVPLSEDRNANEPLRVVLHDMTVARKGKALIPGDIVLFWGRLSYYADLGMTLYADSFIILSKVRKEMEKPLRDLACLAYTDVPNSVTLAGTINNVAGDKVILKIKRTTPVRGELKDYDILPIKTDCPARYNNMDKAVFSGFFFNGEVQGELVNLTPQSV